MEYLIVLGFGGFAQEIRSYWEASNNVSAAFKGYLAKSGVGDYSRQYCIGNDDTYAAEAGDFFVLGMADNAVRRNLIDGIFSIKKWSSINVVHPSATVSPTATIGVGNVIGPHCHIGCNAALGNHNVLNYGCSIGHDSIVGNNNVFASGINVGGYVAIQDDNFLAINVCVLPRIVIGSWNKVHAGTIVAENLKDNSFYFAKYSYGKAFIVSAPVKAKTDVEFL